MPILPSDGKPCIDCAIVKTPESFGWKSKSKGKRLSRCKDCQKLQRAKNRVKIVARNRAYYQSNLEEARAKRRSYREQNRERDLERKREHYQENKETILAQMKAYREANREAVLARKRAYREKNREAIAERKRAHYAVNRDAVLATNRARTLNTEGSHTGADVRLQYRLQKGRCWWCGQPAGDSYHVDHVQPVVKGGSNGPENIVIACAHCNLSKHDRTPLEFAGRLF